MAKQIFEGAARAWVGVVSQAHVQRGVDGGFAQVCHGKRGPLARMEKGDVLVYYSPKVEMGGDEALRAFTAVGRIVGPVYSFDMGGGWVPSRRDVDYVCSGEVPLASIAKRLRFVRDNRNWGWLARRGVFEIDLADAMVIAEAMSGSRADSELLEAG
jgi:hypothetical protein